MCNGSIYHAKIDESERKKETKNERKKEMSKQKSKQKRKVHPKYNVERSEIHSRVAFYAAAIH